ncbi:MAG: hypothetical protein HY876_08455 [Coriobacteriales bacterium]|nr:hypothetical protein [Coriobacteriales bacterium]
MAPGAEDLQRLQNIDYFLDQLARAVERGDVPMESYEALAPSYLAKREALVSRLYSGPAIAQGPSAAPLATTSTGSADALWVTSWADTERTRPGAVRTSQARPAAKPIQVPWPTVLTVLGAFLVVVAAAIFAVATWNLLATPLKLAVMVALTIGFYVAGDIARRKYDLQVGGVALTAVGSAMLLFDGWIAIDGFDLSGPLPWAILLLVVSSVYWLTEIRLAGRYFGVAGAAAQIGWWWLLGEGLGWPMTWRLAAIACVALAWQIAGRRAARSPSVAEFGESLRLAAPVVAAGAAAGALVALAFNPSLDTAKLVAVAVTSLAAGTVWLDVKVQTVVSQALGSAIQVPAIVALGLALSGDPTWTEIGITAAVGLAWLTLAVYAGGAPFATLGVIALDGAVLFGVGEVSATSSAEGALSVVAATGAFWVFAVVLARRWGSSRVPERARSWVLGLEVGAWLTLGGATAATVGLGLFDYMVAGDIPDAVLPGVVSVAWVASALLRGGLTPGIVASASLLYATWIAAENVEALSDWRYACVGAVAALLVLTADYLARAIRTDVRAFAAVIRILVAIVGVTAAVTAYEGDPVMRTDAVVACVTVALALLASGWFGNAVEGVVAGSFLGLAAIGVFRWGTFSPVDGWGACAVAGGALVMCVAGTATKRAQPLLASATAATASVTATLFVTMSAVALFDHPARDVAPLALAWLAISACWVAASIVLRLEEILALAGLTLFAAGLTAVAVLELPAGVTLAVAGIVAFGLLAPSFTRTYGAEGTSSRSGAALAASAFAGLISVTVLAFASTQTDMGAEWMRFGDNGLAVSLIVLGAWTLAFARAWKSRLAWRVGPLAFVLALWVWLGAADVRSYEAYGVPLAAYLAGLSWDIARRGEPGEAVLTDLGAAAALLVPPILSAWTATDPSVEWLHSAVGFMLGLTAIAGGIALRVRSYFFGGVIAVALIAMWRSSGFLTQWWWIVLGLVGCGMLVIALTWERQRHVLVEAGGALKATLSTWR